MTYTTITAQDARRIGDELRALLAPWAADRGLELKVNGGTFGALYFKPRVEFSVLANSDGKSKARAEFEAYAGLFGLDAADYGKTFRHGGRSFTVAGLNFKSRKNPVEVTRDDGTPFRFPVVLAKALLGTRR